MRKNNVIRFNLAFFTTLIIIITILIHGFLLKLNIRDSSRFLANYFDNLISSRIFLKSKLDRNFFDPQMKIDLSKILVEGPNDYIKGIYYSSNSIKYVEKSRDNYLLYEIPLTLFNFNQSSLKHYEILVNNKVVYSNEISKIGSEYHSNILDSKYLSKYGFEIVVGYKTSFFIGSYLLIVLPILVLLLIFYYVLYNLRKDAVGLDITLKNLTIELKKTFEEFKTKRVLSFNKQITNNERINTLQEIFISMFNEFKKIMNEHEKTNEILEETMAELEEANAELVEKNLQIISALAEAVEIKDSVTGNHSKNVMNLSIELAKELDVSDPAELEAIKYGAILHDIGKIGIPEHILNKPGKLDDKEFEIMKKHTIFGEKIIKTIPGWDLVADVIRHHHENWDGSGYPDGLKDGEISLRAQIVAIVDVFVALTEDRPYRKGLSVEKAIEIMKEMVGSKFSPELFEKFIMVLKKRGLIN